jgi:hypothetical protein
MRKPILVITTATAVFALNLPANAQQYPVATSTTTQLLDNYYRGTPQQKHLAEQLLLTATFGMVSLNIMLELKRLEDPKVIPLFCLPGGSDPTAEQLFYLLRAFNSDKPSSTVDFFENDLREVLMRTYPCKN